MKIWLEGFFLSQWLDEEFRCRARGVGVLALFEWSRLNLGGRVDIVPVVSIVVCH